MQRKFNYNKLFSHRPKALEKREKPPLNILDTLTAMQWESIKANFDYKCAYCGREVCLEREHFIPLSKGGELSRNNIIPACKTCNSSKNDKDFYAWFRKQFFYQKGREKYILKYLNYKNQNIQQLRLF